MHPCFLFIKSEAFPFVLSSSYYYNIHNALGFPVSTLVLVSPLLSLLCLHFLLRECHLYQLHLHHYGQTLERNNKRMEEFNLAHGFRDPVRARSHVLGQGIMVVGLYDRGIIRD